MTTRQAEALHTLSQVLNAFTNPTPDLELALRSCLHICQLLSWSHQFNWFYRELNGYPADVARPDYRQVKGKLVWEPNSNMYHNIQWMSEKDVFGKSPEETQEEDTAIDVWYGIDWIIKASQHGSSEETGETKEAYLRSGDPIALNNYEYFQQQTFHTASTVSRELLLTLLPKLTSN